MWGVPAKTILLGLLIGNLLAVLSFTFFAAVMGTSTRLTLYAYLKKVIGPYAQRFYNLVWGLCSIALAGSGIAVAATALREVIGAPIQTEWYPTSMSFVVAAVIMGLVVAIVAANGFEACARFASAAVPWMIVIFFVGALVALPQLAAATGASIGSFADIWAIFDSNVGSGSGNPDAEPMTIFHVACFAWLINLAWHVGSNDMGLFRFAKNYKYGYLSAIGMFVGHYFAWVMVAIMGAAAAAVLGQSLTVLDPGAVTNTVFGLTGITAVIVAGWTTANPTIYRAALSLNTVLPRLSHRQFTYGVGVIMTVLACFPAMTNIGNVVQVLGWATVGIGAIIIIEQFLFPKIGFTRYWAMYRGVKINWAAMIAWGVSILFVLIMLGTGAMHPNFIFIPEFFIAGACYLVLARIMGARDDYRAEELREERFQKELKDLVDEEMEEQLSQGENKDTKTSGRVAGVLAIVAYAALAGIIVTGFFTYAEAMAVDSFKVVAFGLTVVYFVLNGTATYINYKNEPAALT
ncbi:Predicted mannitol permease [Gulosibacter sp. 10]|nr:Predicted mannitol permease [Gulosibacter sp. 10]